MRIIGKVFIGEKNPETYPQDRQELVEKYKPHNKKITDFLLYMYTDIPQYQEFLQEIVSRGQEPRVSYETEWSKKEMDGAEYLMVFTTNQIHEPLGWQLVVTNELPPVHAEMEKEVQVDCPDCGFRSYVREITENILYGPEIREQAVDGFNRSSEYWGIGYYPRPTLIVTQRVRQLIRLQGGDSACNHTVVVVGT